MRTARLLAYLPACTAPGGLPTRGVPAQGLYLPGECTYLGVYLPRGGNLPGGVPAWGGTCPGTPPSPREQNSWLTLLEILPCPKLRLRAVKI